MAETTHRVDPKLYHFATQEHRKEFEQRQTKIDEQDKEIKRLKELFVDIKAILVRRGFPFTEESVLSINKIVELAREE